MNEASLIRQQDLIPESILGTKIHIIGAGAVGSETAMTLAKMGFDNLTIWDDDVVSVENISSQMYGFSDIGKPKVEALAKHLEYFAGVTPEMKAIRYENGQLSGIVICAVDSMSARRQVFAGQAGLSVGSPLVIDPRMGAEFAAVHTYRPMDMDTCESYAKTLHSDQDSVPEPCTAKATSYCSRALASLVAVTVKSFLKKERYAKVVQYHIPTLDMMSFMRQA